MSKLLELSPQDNQNIIKELLTTCKTLSKGSIRLNLSQKKLLLQIFQSKTLINRLNTKLNEIISKYSKRPLKTIKKTLPDYPPPIAKISSEFDNMSSSKQDEELQRRLDQIRRLSISSRKTQKRQISNDRKFAEKLQQEEEKIKQQENDFKFAKKLQEYDDSQLAKKVGIMGSAAFAKGKTFRMKKKSKSPASKKYRKLKK